MEQKKDLTSQKETLINSILGEIKKEGTQARCQNMKGRFYFRLSGEDFINLFSASASAVLSKRGCYWDFMVDNDNILVLHQLYYYMTMSPKFCGDLRKGIMLQGTIGSGKTLLMETYAHMQNFLINKHMLGFGLLTCVSSHEIVTKLKTEELTTFSKRPLMIDELGREPKQIMNYGNTTTPMIDLLCARADKAVITHGTTNFKLSSLGGEDCYGAMVGDRLKAMFNFITLKGESRRV